MPKSKICFRLEGTTVRIGFHIVGITFGVVAGSLAVLPGKAVVLAVPCLLAVGAPLLALGLGTIIVLTILVPIILSQVLLFE